MCFHDVPTEFFFTSLIANQGITVINIYIQQLTTIFFFLTKHENKIIKIHEKSVSFGFRIKITFKK